MSRREKIELLQSILSDPENFQALCDHIAEGSTLTEIAKDWGVHYARLYSWIHDADHPERLIDYSKALECRAASGHDRVVKGVADIMGVDIRRAYGKDGQLLQAHQMPDDVAAALQSMDITTDKDGNINRKIRVSDRIQALTLMGRHLKMFTDKSEVSVLSLEDAVRASMPAKPAPPSAAPALPQSPSARKPDSE